MLENYGGGVDDVVRRFGSLPGSTEAGQALTYLTEDFATPEHIGPKRRANCIAGGDDDQLQAEAFGLVATFLRGVGRVR